jgi:hypothetical protein
MARGNRRRHEHGESRRMAAAETATAVPTRQQVWPRWSSALLLVWVALVYAPSITNGFTYDDPSVIAEASQLLSDPARAGRLFSQDYFRLSNESTYRPFVTLTYMLDWQLGGGAAWAFHVQSVLWHLVAVGALLSLLRRLQLSDPLRFTTGALYGVHPALTEAVNAIAFREDVLVTACGLVGLVLLMMQRPARGVRLTLAAMAFTTALFSKESAMVFAALVPVTFWARNRLSMPRANTPPSAEYLVVVACVAAYAVVRFGVFPAHEQYGLRIGDSMLASWATGAIALAYYLRLLLYPLLLCADYRGVIAVVTTAADWRPWVAVIVLATATGGAWRLRHAQPLVWWGWLWFLIAIAPVSNVVPIPAFMAERFLHLPFVGLVAALVSLSVVVLNRWPQARVMPATAVTVVLACSVLTAQRHRIWSSDEVLWQTTLRDHPRAHGALHGYASAMIERGRYADGIAYLQRLLEDPSIGADRRSAVSI